MATPGRPSKLCDELIDKLCDRVRTTFYYGPAAESLGIPHQTVNHWLMLGRGTLKNTTQRGNRLHKRLVVELDKARAENRMQLEIVGRQLCFGATVTATRKIRTLDAAGNLMTTQEVTETRTLPPDGKHIRFMLEKIDPEVYGKKSDGGLVPLDPTTGQPLPIPIIIERVETPLPKPIALPEPEPIAANDT